MKEANDLTLDDLCELATEAPDGPLEAIRGLLEGVLARGVTDDATTAALTAILDYHLPNLVELDNDGGAVG